MHYKISRLESPGEWLVNLPMYLSKFLPNFMVRKYKIYACNVVN